MAEFSFSTLPEWQEHHISGASTESGQLKRMPDECTAYRNEIRIVLMGKTGHGKSTTGNTILGVHSPKSPEEPGFEEFIGQMSGTTYCQTQSVVINGRPIRIVDTPGLCDTTRDPEEVIFEISKCLLLTLPGPHVILFVVSFMQRFTVEEYKVFYSILEYFKSDITKYIIVVFTHVDGLPCGKSSLEENLERMKEKIQKAKESGRNVPDITEILEKVGHRYVVLNNVGDQETKNLQVYELMQMIDDLVNNNNPKYFSDEITQNITQITEGHLTRIMNDREISQTKAWAVFVQEAVAAEAQEERERQEREERERKEREKVERKKEEKEKEERDKKETEKEQRKKEKSDGEIRERRQIEEQLRMLALRERNVREREDLMKEAERKEHDRREREQMERELKERECRENEKREKEKREKEDREKEQWKKKLERQRRERVKTERENTEKAVGGGVAGVNTAALIRAVASLLVGGAVGAKPRCSIL